MDASRICLSCRKPLDSGAVQGFCPECLIQAGFDTGRLPAPARAAAAPEANPGFEPPGIEEIARLFPQLEVTDLIGRGGMGAVYKARQPALDRWVALKV